jgi:predicted TIM-barrel fold metal-dependent hydrolase
VIAYGGADWSVANLRPYVEHCINSFGWDRVVWGSDWPVCTLFGSLAHWVHASRELVAGCSDDEKARLFSRNAQRIYRLNE